MAYTQDHQPYARDSYRRDPNRPIEPRSLPAVRGGSSPSSFFAVLFILAAILFAGWLAYNHEFGSETSAALKTAPAIGTPAVTPAETTGSAPSRQ